jgi:hypothetical protein
MQSHIAHTLLIFSILCLLKNLKLQFLYFSSFFFVSRLFLHVAKTLNFSIAAACNCKISCKKYVFEARGGNYILFLIFKFLSLNFKFFYLKLKKFKFLKIKVSQPQKNFMLFRRLAIKIFPLLFLHKFLK